MIFNYGNSNFVIYTDKNSPSVDFEQMIIDKPEYCSVETYHTTDELQILRHHVFEIVGYKHSTHVHLLPYETTVNSTFAQNYMSTGGARVDSPQ